MTERTRRTPAPSTDEDVATLEGELAELRDHLRYLLTLAETATGAQLDHLLDEARRTNEQWMALNEECSA